MHFSSRFWLHHVTDVMLIFSRFKARENGRWSRGTAPSIRVARSSEQMFWIWYFYEKKNEMALSTKFRMAGGTRSSNSLVRSKAQGKVSRLEIKNQTYEKLRQRHKKVKPFKCQGVWLLPLYPSPPQPDGILVYCRVPPEFCKVPPIMKSASGHWLLQLELIQWHEATSSISISLWRVC